MPYVEHELGRTFYQVRGRKTAPGLPLVCLHGGPGGQSKRMAGLFELSKDRKVYVYDQVGGGRSSATERARWNIGTFVRELDLLVDAWGLDEFHLFGASWGTTLGLEYFLRHRRRVRSIVFQSPLFSTADWEADAKRLIRALPAHERKVIRTCHEIGATDSQVYKDAMRVYYARHVCRNREQLKRFFSDENPNGKHVYQHMWGPSEFKATGSLKRYDKVHRLAEVSRPALVICGEHDEAQPATGRRYADAMPRGEFAEIGGASHAILAEQPRKLVRTIGQFLERND